jgi:hypothetical protein
MMSHKKPNKKALVKYLLENLDKDNYFVYSDGSISIDIDDISYRVSDTYISYKKKKCR